MKQFILSFLAGILLVSAGTAQKTIRDANAVTRNVASFHGIEVSSGIDLYLSQGSGEALVVSASSNEYRDNIITKVEEGILKIYYYNPQHNSLTINWGNRKLKAYVSVKTLDKLRASGGSDVFVDEELSGERLNISLSGGSDFKGKIGLQELNISSSGGSDVHISGRAANLKIEASGGSDFHGYELVSDNCKVSASGGSDVHITANRQLEVHSSGGSDVYYKGNATSVSTSKSGRSGVKK